MNNSLLRLDGNLGTGDELKRLADYTELEMHIPIFHRASQNGII